MSDKQMSADTTASSEERAIFASGCFWGTEFYMKQAEGVLRTVVGFSGGHVKNPAYREVCSGMTGHAEVIEIYFDPAKTDYETLARLFFETHDPTQVNRQGPDVGTQYRSAIFYLNEEQRQIAEKLIGMLIEQGLDVATEVKAAGPVYPADDYHQDYYAKTGGSPYCHTYTRRFMDD